MRFLASSAWEITDIIKDCYETASVSYLFDSLFFFFLRDIYLLERERVHMPMSWGRGKGREPSRKPPVSMSPAQGSISSSMRSYLNEIIPDLKSRVESLTDRATTAPQLI